MHPKKWIGIVLIAVSFLSTAAAQSNEIVINKVAGEKEQLIIDILSLVLSKTDSQARIRQYSESLPQPRLMDEIKSGNIDLMWVGEDLSLEPELKPIRIPLLKGLLGHRIFIIKKGQQARFNNVKTLDDLKQLNAGQGTDWGDTQILKKTGIPTITTLKFKNLFRMLEGERFDYFPRAVHEPWPEVNYWPELNLTVEKKIMLVYPYAMYFYVKKDNQMLYDKLSQGFETAIADGSFDALFFNNQLIKDALTKTNIKNRTVIKIANPTMHPDTPIDRKALWLDTANL